jgi:hypothetical protein
MMAEEKQLDNKVLDYLDEIGAWGIKYWAGAKYTKKGIPDILACVNGHFFGIEDKAETGKPKLLQLKNLEWMQRAGGFGILLYPNEFDNFKRFLNELRSDDILTDWQCKWYLSNIKLQTKWKEKLEK